MILLLLHISHDRDVFNLIFTEEETEARRLMKLIQGVRAGKYRTGTPET